MASVAPNVHLDISGWQVMARLRPGEFYRTPADPDRHRGGRPHHVGQRLPGAAVAAVRVGLVEALDNPPQEAHELGIGFSGEEVSAILGDNAARLFRL